jgi:hypothetical protein
LLSTNLRYSAHGYFGDVLYVGYAQVSVGTLEIVRLGELLAARTDQGREAASLWYIVIASHPFRVNGRYIDQTTCGGASFGVQARGTWAPAGWPCLEK